MHEALRLVLQVALATTTLMAAAIAQEAAPSLQPGDTWRFRETDLLTKNEVLRYTERVHAVAGGDFWLHVDNGRSRTWWQGDAERFVRLRQYAHADDQPDQRGKQIGSASGGFAKRWPLKVGITFDCSEDTTWPNGWKISYELKCSVEGSEAVNVAAGHYETFRIEAKGSLTNATNNFTGRHERSIWYAPAARTDVKREYRTWSSKGQLTRVEGHELIEFKPGG